MGRKVGLDRDAVVGAAATIADRDGLEAVTLASVAAALSVRSPSLYNHIDGLDHLIRLLSRVGAGELRDRIAAAAGTEDPAGALAAVCHAYRRYAAEHPGLYAAAQRAVKPGEDDETYAVLGSVVEEVQALLSRLGVPGGDQIDVIRVIRSALHGFAVLERHGGFGMPQSVDQSFDRLVDLLTGAIAQG